MEMILFFSAHHQLSSNTEPRKESMKVPIIDDPSEISIISPRGNYAEPTEEDKRSARRAE